MSEPTVFFIDRCLGRKVANALTESGLSVRYHDDIFIGDPAPADEVWLPEVGSKNWVVLTKDKMIRRRAAEVEIVRKSTQLPSE